MYSDDKDSTIAKIIDDIVETEDNETAHIILDNILCDILYDDGYHKVIAAYRRAPKWYA